MTLQEGTCPKRGSFTLSVELNPWMFCLSAHVVPKKIFPLGLVKQVKIICVNYSSKIRLLGSNIILIAVSTAFDMMKGGGISLSNKDINKNLTKTFFWIPLRGLWLLHIKQAARDHLNWTETREWHVIPMTVPYLGFTPKMQLTALFSGRKLCPSTPWFTHPKVVLTNLSHVTAPCRSWEEIHLLSAHLLASASSLTSMLAPPWASRGSQTNGEGCALSWLFEVLFFSCWFSS